MWAVPQVLNPAKGARQFSGFKQAGMTVEKLSVEKKK